MAAWPAVHVEEWDCIVEFREQGGEVDAEVFAVIVFDMCNVVGERVVVRFDCTPVPGYVRGESRCFRSAPVRRNEPVIFIEPVLFGL